MHYQWLSQAYIVCTLYRMPYIAYPISYTQKNGHLSYKVTFDLSQTCPHNTGLTVYILNITCQNLYNMPYQPENPISPQGPPALFKLYSNILECVNLIEIRFYAYLYASSFLILCNILNVYSWHLENRSKSLLNIKIYLWKNLIAKSMPLHKYTNAHFPYSVHIFQYNVTGWKVKTYILFCYTCIQPCEQCNKMSCHSMCMLNMPVSPHTHKMLT
jgi:hypothetical protein